MSEVWLRIAIIAGAVLVIVVVVAFMRPRRSGEIGGSTSGMAPGVYLFTSGTCADCVPAREQLLEKLGPGGFHEIEWEQDPDAFTRAGIDVVPCTVVVGLDGSATSFPGMPDPAFEWPRKLNP